ncbi:hypothetical protein [uncultured Gemmiger sp.]|uniref:hypothetical protein n=1 Tax=uncultured Gemmiger sp. TaxID=1623490 RepID=UPI0025F25830|nr:hypothetical protein [uncultured Gemmiger sp.]
MAIFSIPPVFGFFSSMAEKSSRCKVKKQPFPRLSFYLNTGTLQKPYTILNICQKKERK